MTDAIVWEEPPPTNYHGFGKRHTPARDFITELAKQPGRWGRYPKNNTGYVAYLRKVAGELGYEIEAVTRQTDDPKRRAVYARVIERD